MNETAQQNMENHPVIRTLYDHVDEVTCLAFHPSEQILASGSRDYTLKLFDYSKPSAKRAFKYIQVSFSCFLIHTNQVNAVFPFSSTWYCGTKCTWF